MNVIAVDDNTRILLGFEKKIQKVVPDGQINVFCKPSLALDYVRNHTVDVAFLDIDMHGMNGIELAVEIKKLNSVCNIIYVTGYKNYAYEAMSTRPSGYLIKPVSVEDIEQELIELRTPVDTIQNKEKLRVRTFGGFIVYDKDGEPVKFSRSYAKEILAYVIDKKGYPVTSKDIARDILEQKTFDAKVSKEVSKYVRTLLQDMNTAGYEKVLIKTRNSLNVDVSMIDCDYYKMMEGNTETINQFHDDYLIEYSWAEMTYGDIRSAIEGYK